MKRSTFGTLPLAALAVVAACNSDPTADLAAGADTLIATPAFLILDSAGTASVDLQLFDEQLNALPLSVQVDPGNTAVATTEPDTTFRPGLGSNRLIQRFTVTGVSTDSTTVTFSVGSKRFSMPVTVTVDGLTFSDLLLSSLAPALGTAVTITSNGDVNFNSGTAVTFDIAGTGRSQAAIVTAFTANDITFFPIPGSVGGAEISGAEMRYRPGTGSVTVTTGDSVTVPPLPVTITPANPLPGDTVTVTLGGGFKFIPGGRVIAGTAPIQAGKAADSSAISLIPRPGTKVLAFLDSVVLPSAPAMGIFSLTVADSIVVPLDAGSHYAGSDDPTTAPPLVLPLAVGDSIEIYDRFDPALIDQFYALNLPTGMTLTITTDWDGSADVDVLRCNPATPACSGAIGTFGATAAHPEVAQRVLAAGNYVLWVNLYAGLPPTFVKIKIRRDA